MGKASRRRRERRLGLAPAPSGSASLVMEREPVVDLMAATAGTGKISAALLDVAKPFLEDGFNLDQVRRVVYCAVIAWNLSLVDTQTREVEMERVLKALPAEDREVYRDLFDLLAETKMRLHPEDRRFIVSAEVVETGSSYRVIALCAAPAP